MPLLVQLIPVATEETLRGSVVVDGQRVQKIRTTELRLLVLCCFCCAYAFYFTLRMQHSRAAGKQRWLLSADEQGSIAFHARRDEPPRDSKD